MNEDYALGTAVERVDDARERIQAEEELVAAQERLLAAVQAVGAEWLNGFALVLENVVKAAGTEDYSEIHTHLMEARSAVYEYDQNLTKRTYGQGIGKFIEFRRIPEALREWELAQ